MTRTAWMLLAAVAAWPQGATAQQGGAGQPLSDTQLLGRRLVVQSCGVCHVKVQRTSALFGPALSKESASGNDEAMREVIANGTPRMPGFKHHFERAEIDAIVAYLKTVPAPQPAQPR
jgi:mono/diheme cytochrome c family protein